VNHWIKPIGTGQHNLPADWLAQRPGVLERTGFSRRPQVADGDRFVFYASGWRCIFAIVEGVGDPEETRPGQRWPWSMAVEPLLVIPRLDRAPPLEAIGVVPRSLSQHSHIRLSPEHYERAVDVIASIAH
jgi:hypothetical protein